MTSDVRRVLEHARALLLDFDGPICSVFSGFPAPVVANQLRGILAEGGHHDLPAEVARSGDPFDVFRYAATLSAEDARMVNAAFTAHEAEAITNAAPTPGAHDFIRAWHSTGRPLAIVSNNGAPAINTYLDLHHLRAGVAYIAARVSDNAELLKPNPHLLNEALTALNIAPAEAVLIGDSTTDIEAAHRAGAPVIAYANKPGKRARFESMRPSAIIDCMVELELANK